MNQGFPRLLGDIGGTNARWAWQASAGADLEDISVQPCGASASLQDSARSYLHLHGRQDPQWAGIGIATAITGDEVRMTNNDWRFSISEFQQALGLKRCLVINDFTSLALSLPALKPSDLRAIGGGSPAVGQTIGSPESTTTTGGSSPEARPRSSNAATPTAPAGSTTPLAR